MMLKSVVKLLEKIEIDTHVSEIYSMGTCYVKGFEE